MIDDMLNDWTSTKTYATRGNLEKVLCGYGFATFKHLVVRTPEGRWTAVFLKNFFPVDVNFMIVVFAGFKVVG